MAIRFRLPALLRGQRPEPDLVEPRWRLLPWARWRHLAETLRSNTSDPSTSLSSRNGTGSRSCCHIWWHPGLGWRDSDV